MTIGNQQPYDRESLISPATNTAAITTDDSAELGYLTRGIYVGTAGDVTLIAQDDSTATTFVGVPAGTVLAVRARIVKATGTTADNLVAMY